MNVGSLAEFTSTVVYSQQGHIVVQVRELVQKHIIIHCR